MYQGIHLIHQIMYLWRSSSHSKEEWCIHSVSRIKYLLVEYHQKNTTIRHALLYDLMKWINWCLSLFIHSVILFKNNSFTFCVVFRSSKPPDLSSFSSFATWSSWSLLDPPAVQWFTLLSFSSFTLFFFFFSMSPTILICSF